jgi:hypothetical protein
MSEENKTVTESVFETLIECFAFLVLAVLTYMFVCGMFVM